VRVSIEKFPAVSQQSAMFSAVEHPVPQASAGLRLREERAVWLDPFVWKGPVLADRKCWRSGWRRWVDSR